MGQGASQASAVGGYSMEVAKIGKLPAWFDTHSSGELPIAFVAKKKYVTTSPYVGFLGSL